MSGLQFDSRFAINPTSVDMKRSRFSRDSSVKTSFNVGELIPFYIDEVLPGDTFDVKTSKVVRLQTLITPMMDNMFLDTYFFFVPNRLVWNHWREMNGENTSGYWAQTTEYTVPQTEAPSSTGWSVGTIADYFGIPTGVEGISVNSLPFRAYAMIVNEFFRDQNLVTPCNVTLGDSTTTGSNGSTFVTDIEKGGKPFIVAKMHDYFTSCLPSPQKGPDVKIPVASGGKYPVVPFGDDKMAIGDIVAITGDTSLSPMSGLTANAFTQQQYLHTVYSSSGNATYNYPYAQADGNGFVPSNLYAVDVDPVAATINQLRLAFQIQRLYEKDSRGGTRYIELLKSHFGVTSPDSRLQRPEYLGGNRIPITINQVIQQSGTVSGSTPQGNVSGMSLTTDVNDDFFHSFTEHGFVIGLCCARYHHTYQQGIERLWSRKTRFDYYWPVFANIGEQAVLNKEIYADGSDDDDGVFGYQEAWADYRYKPSRVTGEMRSSYTTSLDSWHLADDYQSLPSLSSDWIAEDKSNVDRVLAVASTVSNQLMMDCFVKNTTTRVMPMYSIPGLIDHM